MKLYPIFLHIDGKPCLVVGGGNIGQRKVEDLLIAGARVTLVSREVTAILQNLADEKKISLLKVDFKFEHLNGMALAIAATNSLHTNRSISASAQARGIPVNVIDQPELCSFVVPATIRRGDLIVAIGTGGRSPALAKKLRGDLEEMFGPEYEFYLELLGAIRERVLSCRRDHPDNSNLFTRIVASPLLHLLISGDQAGLQDLLAQLLAPVLPEEEIQNLQFFAVDLCQNISSFQTETSI